VQTISPDRAYLFVHTDSVHKCTQTEYNEPQPRQSLLVTALHDMGRRGELGSQVGTAVREERVDSKGRGVTESYCSH